jgi:hypothetical protein
MNAIWTALRPRPERTQPRSPSRAYIRLVVDVERLEWHEALSHAEADLLREAADARLFADEDRDRWLALAEIVFELLSERAALPPAEVAALRDRLRDVEPCIAAA